VFLEKYISYLYQYGSPRETDLINFGVQRLGSSENGMRKLLDEMGLYGRLERVAHRELEPAVAYIKYGDMVPLELEMQASSDSMGKGKISEQHLEVAKMILSGAERTAEKRIKRKIAHTKPRKY
jgi:hypothetical protein